MRWDKAGQFSALNFSDAHGFSAPESPKQNGEITKSVVFVVDDEYFSRVNLRLILETSGHTVREFIDCESFLNAYSAEPDSCLVLDVHFPGMSGLELLNRLENMPRLPTIIVSGRSSISEAVQSMKSGVLDFMEKPVDARHLLDAVQSALNHSRRTDSQAQLHELAVDHLADLTPRQKQVMNLVLAGHPSKNIAFLLGVSQRTVENHRASIMHKTGATSLPALARLVIAASNYRQDASATL
jgi:two-component system CheB/CheR fusion protein